MQNRLSYRCHSAHSLEFIIKPRDSESRRCTGCLELSKCQSICRTCRTQYCAECRSPPCSKTQCPKGHSFLLVNSPTHSCDLCGVKAGVLNQQLYYDKWCNLKVCELCQSRLPSNSQVQSIQNNFEECCSGHLLDYLRDSLIARCSHCGDNKRLERYCPVCNTLYCL